MATIHTINSNDRTTPAGKKKFKRPTTIFDDGEPTDSCIFDAKRVLRLIEDERHLSAEILYDSVVARIQTEDVEEETKKKKAKRKRNNCKKALDRKEAADFLEENKEIIRQMEERCELFKKAKKNLDVNDDWTLGHTLFGVTTYYRHESDGSLSIKLEGRVDECSLFDQVAVIREFDLNHYWAPFVTSSLTVGEIDKMDIVGWFVLGLPNFGYMRDALFRAIGCDSIYEDGSILIYAFGIQDRPDEGADDTDSNIESTPKAIKNVRSEDEHNRIIDGLRNDPVLNTLDLPPIPKGVGRGRMTIRSVAAQIDLESPTSSVTTLIANIDPNLRIIPQFLIDFVMKRVCGTILYKMKLAAQKISKNPVTNHHAIKIREEKDFYKTFLLSKFEGVCKIRGWEMPTIAAFDLSEAQLEMAESFKAKQQRKSDTEALKMLNANDTNNNLDEYLQSSNGETVGDSDNASEEGPNLHTMSNDLDDMSDISKFSSASSFWRSNPIANLKRQAEEKAQLRKDRAIQESRERAAARLKPKSLDEDAKLRLKQLREARKRRKIRNEIPAVKENGHAVPSQMNQSMQRWQVSFSNHGFFTKIFVLQFLMVSLFCFLYLETAFSKVVAVREETYGMERARDIATVTYMVVAGFLHSMFCHIALIYAFSSSHLGSIAGKKTINFYSKFVHHAVAITSASMVALGIIKPTADQCFRWLIWNVYSLFSFVESVFLEKIPGLYTIIHAAFAVISSTQTVFLESNILSGYIASVTRNIFTSIVNAVSYPFMAYVDAAIEHHESGSESPHWREDAFYTARALLSHSAVFLFILLLFFNIFATQARQAISLG